MGKNRFVHQLTKALVDVMFYGGIVTCILVAVYTNKVLAYLGYPLEWGIPMALVLTVSGLTAVYIMWQLKVIFKTLVSGDPFVLENVNALRKIGAASFSISIIYLFKIMFWPTLATVIIVLMFAVAGLFCLTLKDVFKQAVLYKQENDLTV